MAESNNSCSRGIGFTGALFLLFLGLKLGNVIDWSWWWITCPLWGPSALVCFIGFIILIIVGITDIVGMRK